MRGNAASLGWSGDYPGSGSFVALTITTIIDALPAYWTFIAALNMGLASRSALRQTPLEILTLTRRSRQVSQPANFPATPTIDTNSIETCRLNWNNARKFEAQYIHVQRLLPGSRTACSMSLDRPPTWLSEEISHISNHGNECWRLVEECNIATEQLGGFTQKAS